MEEDSDHWKTVWQQQVSVRVGAEIDRDRFERKNRKLKAQVESLQAEVARLRSQLVAGQLESSSGIASVGGKLDLVVRFPQERHSSEADRAAINDALLRLQAWIESLERKREERDTFLRQSIVKRDEFTAAERDDILNRERALIARVSELESREKLWDEERTRLIREKDEQMEHFREVLRIRAREREHTQAASIFRTGLAGPFVPVLRDWLPELDSFVPFAHFMGAEFSRENMQRQCKTSQPVLMIFQTPVSVFGWFGATGVASGEDVEDPSRTSFLFLLAGRGLSEPKRFSMKVDVPRSRSQCSEGIISWNVFGVKEDRQVSRQLSGGYDCPSTEGFGHGAEVTEVEVFVRE